MLPRICLVVLLLSFATSVHAAGPYGTQAGQPLTDTGYIVITDQVAQAIADTGAGFVRVNFRLGPYQSDTTQWYQAYDTIVDRLRSRGLEVIALMTNEAWPGGQSLWTDNAYETTGGDGWNPYLNNWCNFFSRAAEHWKGKIRYWELWNEPDCLAVIYPSNYGALLAHAYDLAHTNNIPVEIISGGVCGGSCTDPTYGPAYISKTYDVSINHTGWFTQMKDKWGTYPLDHVGFHIYPNCDRALSKSWLSSYCDCFHNAYASYEGASTTKKMWLTEIGWQTGGTDCHTTEAIQAANVTSFLGVVNGKSYIKNVCWFFLQDSPVSNLYYGVYRDGSLSEANRKPAWTNLNVGLTYEGRYSSGGKIDQPILDYFNTKGHVAVGNPFDNGGTAWVHDWDFGPVQDYDGGTMGRMTVFDAADGHAYSVRSHFWDAMSAHHTALEFPLGDQVGTGGGEKQAFEGGLITWSEAGGTVMTLYTYKLPIDNSDSGFSSSVNWSLRTVSDGFKDGAYRRLSATTTNSDAATWSIPVPHSGTYDVYARWPAVTGATSNATYEITHAGGTATITADQSARSGRWNLLGAYTFNVGTATVRLSSQGSAGSYICADAVRLIYTDAQPDTTPPSVPVVTDDGQYTTVSTSLHCSWTSSDPESGIEHYEYAVAANPTDPGTGYTVPWTSTGTVDSVTCTALFGHGATYYFYVRAYNSAGLVSEEGVSDGIKVDLSPPTRPTVTDDGDYTGLANSLHCSWNSADAESGIIAYDYSVGTVPYGSDVVPLTSAGSSSQVWLNDLTLPEGKTYYFTVRATNGAGRTSTQGYSDGIQYRPAVQAAGIADALSRADGTVVTVHDAVVTASFADSFFVCDPGRLPGLAIQPGRVLPEGTVVDVTGEMHTLVGARVLTTGCVTPVQP